MLLWGGYHENSRIDGGEFAGRVMPLKQQHRPE
jgi:hypothetical protein